MNRIIALTAAAAFVAVGLGAANAAPINSTQLSMGPPHDKGGRGGPPGNANKRGGPPGKGGKAIPPGQAKKLGDFGRFVGFHQGGGPPPWAPAWGYRRKRYSGHPANLIVPFPGITESGAFVAPFGLSGNTCHRQTLSSTLGTLGGAALGGYLGSQIGSGSGKTAATIGGVILGAMVGGSIGRQMDVYDQACVGQALEYMPNNEPVAWQDPNDNVRYRVIPQGTVESSSGQYCREYTATAVIDGRNQVTNGIACRDSEGRWRLAN